MAILEIPIELKSMFEADPDNFIRDIANFPQESVSRYFKNTTAIIKAIDRSTINLFDFNTHKFSDKFRANNSFNRYMHFDLSLGGDLCSFAMGHTPGFIQVNVLKEGKLEKVSLPFTIIDFVGILLVGRNEEVWLPEITHLIHTISDRGFNLTLLTFDRFQSAYLMQELRDEGYLTSNLSIDKTANYPVIDMDREDMIAKKSTEGNYLAAIASLKDSINQGRIKIPYHPSIDNRTSESEFEVEAKSAQEDLTKKKVDHPQGGRIDLLQAIAGVVFNIQNNQRASDVKEGYEKEIADDFYHKLEVNRPNSFESLEDFSKPRMEIRNETYLG